MSVTLRPSGLSSVSEIVLAYLSNALVLHIKRPIYFNMSTCHVCIDLFYHHHARKIKFVDMQLFFYINLQDN